MKKILVLLVVGFIFFGSCVLFYIEPDPPVISYSIDNIYGMVVNWDRIAGAKGYRIYYFFMDDALLTYGINQTRFGCNVSTRISSSYRGFDIKITSFNDKGESNFSNVIYYPYE